MECRESKTELNRKLREYKAGKKEREEFVKEKKRHKWICEEGEEKLRKNEIDTIMNTKDETEMNEQNESVGRNRKE